MGIPPSRLTRLLLVGAGTNASPQYVQAVTPGIGALQICEFPPHFELAVEEIERLRWYQENYPAWPNEATTKAARDIEQDMEAIGSRLFDMVFAGAPAAVHDALRTDPGALDVEIMVDERTNDWPWELLRDPRSGAFLALTTRSFARVTGGAGETVVRPSGDGIRVLYVIARPSGRYDVKYRAVSAGLLRTLSAGSSRVSVQVLRPATIESMMATLRVARERGNPVDVVHFDGHGGLGAGRRSHLLFERGGGRVEEVDGSTLAQALTECGVRLFVTNACRSAFSPSPIEDVAPMSLGHELIEGGVPAVVAMRYRIYAPSAASFMAQFYDALGRGNGVRVAARIARAVQAADPWRPTASGRPVAVWDWPLAIVYERVGAFVDSAPLPVPTSDFADATDDRHFIGRDEVLVELDRSFDTSRLVLLSGLVGSGKTATADEFADWYEVTGGLSGPVLFSEVRAGAKSVIDAIGAGYFEAIQARGIDWRALERSEQLAVASELLANRPGLWVIDDVDLATTDHDREAIRSTLRMAQRCGVKVLVTACARQIDWLGAVPTLIPQGNMPPDEVRMLGAARSAMTFDELDDFEPVLKIAEGNPLTIEALVDNLPAIGDRIANAGPGGQSATSVLSGSTGAAAERLASRIDGALDRLSEADVAVLANVSCFTGAVNVLVVFGMGHIPSPWSVDTIRQMTIEQVEAVLDRAADAGLLRCVMPGTYALHPALGWRLSERMPAPSRLAAERAFVVAMATTSSYFLRQGELDGADVDWGPHLSNLDRAARIAVGFDVELAVQLLQVVQVAIAPTYGWAPVRALFDAVLNELSDDDGRPAPDRVTAWLKVTDALAIAAEHVGDRKQALAAHEATLQERRARVERRSVEDDETEWTPGDRDDLRSLAVGLNNAAPLLSWRHFSDGFAAAAEAASLAERLGDTRLRTNALLQQGAICLAADVAQYGEAGERALHEGLALAVDLGDRALIGKLRTELATLSYERALLEAGPTRATLLEQALSEYGKALVFTPAEAVGSRALLHYQAALVQSALGDLEAARKAFEAAIQLYERNGAERQASEMQLAYARCLASFNHVREAQSWAETAANCEATRDDAITFLASIITRA